MNITGSEVWLLACMVLSICIDQHSHNCSVTECVPSGGAAMRWLAYQTCSIGESRSNASNILVHGKLGNSHASAISISRNELPHKADDLVLLELPSVGACMSKKVQVSPLKQGKRSTSLRVRVIGRMREYAIEQVQQCLALGRIKARQATVLCDGKQWHAKSIAVARHTCGTC